jgi:hypothetical protein
VGQQGGVGAEGPRAGHGALHRQPLPREHPAPRGADLGEIHLIAREGQQGVPLSLAAGEEHGRGGGARLGGGAGGAEALHHRLEADLDLPGAGGGQGADGAEAVAHGGHGLHAAVEEPAPQGHAGGEVGAPGDLGPGQLPRVGGVVGGAHEVVEQGDAQGLAGGAVHPIEHGAEPGLVAVEPREQPRGRRPFVGEAEGQLPGLGAAGEHAAGREGIQLELARELGLGGLQEAAEGGEIPRGHGHAQGLVPGLLVEPAWRVGLEGLAQGGGQGRGAVGSAQVDVGERHEDSRAPVRLTVADGGAQARAVLSVRTPRRG